MHRTEEGDIFHFGISVGVGSEPVACLAQYELCAILEVYNRDSERKQQMHALGDRSHLTELLLLRKLFGQLHECESVLESILGPERRTRTLPFNFYVRPIRPDPDPDPDPGPMASTNNVHPISMMPSCHLLFLTITKSPPRPSQSHSSPSTADLSSTCPTYSSDRTGTTCR